MNVPFLFEVAILALSVPLTVLSKTSTKQKVILLLSDGLRWDRFGVDVPNLDEIEKNGVRADWLDGVFPTMTMPSTFSIATGLYPESHGVVMNEYFDKVTKERTYKFVDTLNVTKWFDTGVEPIWVTAKNAGKSVGSILYIASWLPIKGVQPDRVVPLSPYFWDNYSLKERVRDAVNWISDDLDLVLVYFNNPDFVLHSYPIEDKHSIQSVKDVDTQIGYLFQLIEERGLSDEVNVIIVSDHGFIDMKPRKFIRLYDYTDESNVEFLVDYGPAIFQLAPVAGKLEKTWDPSTDKISGGNHGYDNRWMSMKSSFYAQGPFFKKGYRARPLESVDIYGMVCEILDIPPAPNNGSRDRYVDMITSSGAPLSPRRLIFILLVLVVIACRE